eukprot:CAMPEP_0171261952 /NCGR_PEP_ID=MMETSP0790-20130122/56281_1 /TAXON_ID=2925 /ORGANISM="Alexandrium catenella, Strain OF101" /LENGTH=125 /DNA_ID=CAMNT_0011730419 /DNA_START=74 /DNA_END=451 /DNA_ORIENTATION=+
MRLALPALPALTLGMEATASQHLPHRQPEVRERADALKEMIFMVVNGVSQPATLAAFKHTLDKDGSYWLHARAPFVVSVVTILLYVVTWRGPVWRFTGQKLDEAEREYWAAHGGKSSAGEGKKEQ